MIPLISGTETCRLVETQAATHVSRGSIVMLVEATVASAAVAPLTTEEIL